jgi:hypothetical protein
VALSAEVGDQALQSDEDFVPHLSLARRIPQAYVLLRGFQGLVPAVLSIGTRFPLRVMPDGIAAIRPSSPA